MLQVKSVAVNAANVPVLVPTRPRARRAARSKPALIALMVTDVVGSTALMQTLGDERARALLHRHDTLLRASIARHRGIGVNHTGDGFVAGFTAVRVALDCALDIQRTLAQPASEPHAPLQIRIALHAGDVLFERGRLFGLSVNTTFRVCARAAANSIHATDRFVELADGYGQAFGRRKYLKLKGLRARVAIHELVQRQSCRALERRPAGRCVVSPCQGH
jgi:class 3 adenylate cyclase